MVGEAEFAQRLAKALFQVILQSRSVKGLGGFGFVGLQRLALDEEALAGEDRRQFLVAGSQRLQFLANAEQPANEIFDMRGEFDEESRFILARRWVQPA